MAAPSAPGAPGNDKTQNILARMAETQKQVNALIAEAAGSLGGSTTQTGGPGGPPAAPASQESEILKEAILAIQHSHDVGGKSFFGHADLGAHFQTHDHYGNPLNENQSYAMMLETGANKIHTMQRHFGIKAISLLGVFMMSAIMVAGQWKAGAIMVGFFMFIPMYHQICELIALCFKYSTISFMKVYVNGAFTFINSLPYFIIQCHELASCSNGGQNCYMNPGSCACPSSNTWGILNLLLIIWCMLVQFSVIYDCYVIRKDPVFPFISFIMTLFQRKLSELQQNETFMKYLADAAKKHDPAVGGAENA